ncbi:hypothetical protein [Nonomuraea insulae]|uniref:Uncharacterized protein n=1 Tax=Nonomuraea insulae TaxID=1616787 RepID=A0ABW1CIN2_9ACTN
MSLETITYIGNLMGVFLALTIGVRLGYVLANRGTRRDIELIDRHFESGLQSARQQHELQLGADRQRQFREELKAAYDALGIWLYDLERTFDELYWGTRTEDDRARNKARMILDKGPWEVVRAPVALTSAELYWSGEVRRLIRMLQGAYIDLDARVRVRLPIEGDQGGQGKSWRPDLEQWDAKEKLLEIIGEIRDQMRSDLSA